jgi:amino acid adenylation domain-containing protein
MTNLTDRITQLSPQKREILLRKLQSNQEETIIPTIQPQGRDTNIFPLSFSQERLWFLYQLEPDNPFYNQPTALRLTGELKISVLAQSLKEIIRRHEILRTNFTIIAGKPAQIINPSVNCQLPVIDLEALSIDDRNKEVKNLADLEAKLPFNLEQDSLLRVTVLKISASEHIVLFTTHHIISDAWSTRILVQEIEKIYQAFASGKPSPLSELKIQYADFTIWQRQWLTTEVLETQLSYWQKQLKDMVVLDFPTDYFRSTTLTYIGNTLSFSLSKSLTEALKVFSDQEKVTLFMTLLAAFKVLMHRYSHQDDIAVGVPIANRNRADIEEIIGFFMNTLVLRTKISGNLNFRELIQQVKNVTLEAYTHQDFPFEQLVEELRPNRYLNRNPLFDTMFTFENVTIPELNLSDLTISSFEQKELTSKFDLFMAITETEGRLKGTIEYSTDLFKIDTIKRLSGHFQVLLTAIVANPESKLSDLPLLTEAEQQQLLAQWNKTKTQYSTEKCIHQLFEEQVEKTPDTVAVIFENQQLTYLELNQKANQLARYLQKLGVQPETKIGILVERSLEMIIGILGILKAGGAYVPIEPTYPQERLAFVLENSQTSILLSQQHLVEKIEKCDIQFICLDTDWEKIYRERRENPCSGITSNNLAYVIYTSGSTGKPKGVLIKHSNVVRLFASTQAWFEFSDCDVWTLFHSYAFDFSVWELWGALLHGGRLVVVSYWLSRSPEDFLLLLCNEKVTILNQTPSAFRQLIQADVSLGKENPLSLRLVIFGGEALELQSLKLWFERHSDRSPQLVNMYGITETTVHVTYRLLNMKDLKLSVGSIIGRPIPDLQVYILDDNQQLLPIGVPGEMHIGGAGLAEGYLKRPELTAEKFIPNPFSNKIGERLYKTGDLARYLSNGDIEYMGRIDRQVKIRGFRIELGEIETVLQSHPLVEQTIVMPQPNDTHIRKDRKISVVPQFSLSDSLVAYLTVKSLPQDTGELLPEEQWRIERVSQWGTVFQKTYQQNSYTYQPNFNISGWNSSYTDSAIPAVEMRMWVDDTVEQIMALKPNRVLEIGCGSGLLLFSIAPHCSYYLGTDLSSDILNRIHQQLVPQNLPQVKLAQKAADDFVDIETDAFDTVILNSVVQYFPDVDYLLRVLEGAIHRVKAGGAIFIGDLRSLALLEAFHASVQLHKASSSLSIGELNQQVQNCLYQEQELIIASEFFTALQQKFPQINLVEIKPKRHNYNNELSKFRYDVILRINTKNEFLPNFTWLNWHKEKLTSITVRQMLAGVKPEILGISGVPNARIESEIKVLELLANADNNGVKTIADLQNLLEKNYPEYGVDPEELWDLSEEFSYHIYFNYASNYYDLVFVKQTSVFSSKVPIFPRTQTQVKSWINYANNPLQGKLTRELVPQLHNYLQKKLLEHMIPSNFILLKEFPLTANGKVDRRALLSYRITPTKETYLAPRTPVEEIITNIWQQVLNLEKVSINDNFFELGGHSLLATQVISQIRQNFSVELPLRRLFELPTVAALAVDIETILRSQKQVEIPSIKAVARNRNIPLSFAQQRLWFLYQLNPDSPAYNISEALHLQGKLSIKVLIQTFEAISQRHEILCTKFQIVAGESVQVVNSTVNFQLPVVDLANLSKTLQEQQVSKLAEIEALQSFDLEKDCLLRVTLIRLNDLEHIVLFTMHHIISDGWSMGILVREIATLYESFIEKKLSPLPELPIQYADYAVWQRDYLQGEVLDKQLSYWKKQLADAPPLLDLPIASPRTEIRTMRGRTQTLVISKILSQELKKLSAKNGVTLFMTLLAAFQTLLHWYTNKEDIVVGTDIANRHRGEIENLIGFFVNQLVLRTDLSENPSFQQLLERVRKITLDAYANQDLPFDKLVEAINPKRDLSYTPLFQVKIILQNTPMSSLELPNLKLNSIDVDKKTVEYDLLLNIEDTETELIALLKYDTDLFSDNKIAELLDNLEIMISTIARQPELKLSEIKSILTKAEEERQKFKECDYQNTLTQKLGNVRRKSLT